MKPAWDKLMKEYAGSKTALVADVDCTDSGKDLCETHGVEGFPTIKWGDPTALEDYEGGRDLEELQAFAAENLKPMCSPTNIDLCDDDKKKLIQSYQGMSPEALSKKIEEAEETLKAAETKFEEEVQKLQDQYEALEKEKTKTIADIKAGGLSLMKAVQAAAGGGREDL